MTESKLEAKCVRAARDKGWVYVKGASFANRGTPDRVFFGPDRRVFFVEFKQPGRRPTKLQEKRHAELSELGHVVYVVSDYDHFRWVLQYESGQLS